MKDLSNLGDEETELRQFSFPVIYTTTGTVIISAKNHEEAIAEAQKLNDEGVDYYSIEDAETHSEVLIGEMEEVN
jgi:hypothetical protein